MHLNRIVSGTLVGLALVASLAAAAGSARTAASKPTTPYAQVFGPDSQVAERAFHRIRDQGAWEAVWAQHVGDSAAIIAGVSTAPVIDFDRCEVIAFFRGRATNIRGELVKSLEQVPEGRRLRFDSSTYQTASFFSDKDGEDSGVACTPFGFWIIERADSAIIVEENVQNRLGGPPEWLERTRLTVEQ